ncbi:hypothetical protein B7494_g2111 [Chlorociboria aeruginascens]|nr:hypothetical protein B7494_g2111 [Chlorociboria aeruginascens]
MSAEGESAVAAPKATSGQPQGMRKNGKKWHSPRRAFRPKAGNSTFEKRQAERQAMAAVRAKEKDMKDEKEADRQAHIQRIKDKRERKIEKERYEKLAETMHRKRVERLKRKEKRNKMLKSYKLYKPSNSILFHTPQLSMGTSTASEISKYSSSIHQHQVTRSIFEVSLKVHKHHHSHMHRHKEDKSPQSAQPYSANPSLQPNGNFDTRSEGVTPVESRNESRRGSTFHSATEKPEFGWPGRERVIKEGEIAEEKEKGILRATELRNSLMGLSTLSNNTTRRLDNSYYSVLEKLSTLRNTITTLKELGSMTRALNSEFQHESEEISKEVDAQIRAFSNFKSQGKLISDLAKRVHAGRSKLSALGARVEVIRERVEGKGITDFRGIKRSGQRSPAGNSGQDLLDHKLSWIWKMRNLEHFTETGTGAAIMAEKGLIMPSETTPPATNGTGRVLTGKQEHYLKRELIFQQVKFEITELNSPTALQRFGAPFKSDFGEVSPLDSDLPILRYIFVHHVREFPFLDKAKEKEFWQDKLQVFLQSFANKHISSSEDRLEETKRRKLAIKCQKLVELMMVSGIPTASGYEERIRFSELEVVDAGAIDHGVLSTMPEGHYMNGWDVNVAGVRTTLVKRNIRYHKHAEFILRVKKKGELEYFIGRRYGDFNRLHKKLRTELPGKILPPMPKKNKQSSTTTSLISGITGKDDDNSSLSSVSTMATGAEGSTKNLILKDHRRSISATSMGPMSPRPSSEIKTNGSLVNGEPVTLWRENQRVSLRAFLRTLLANPQIAQTRAIQEFLSLQPLTPKDEDVEDISRRKAMDEKRVEEQKQFYEIARKRAAELDVYMEQFRRDIVESNGLTKLFAEIKEKKTIQDLSIQYQKFAEWLRIEVAATIYHLFLAEDNSPELFAQAKKIHSMIPYTIIKNAIRIANPAAVMASILDIFLAQPFGARSLMQRIFSLTLNDGIRSFQKSIDALVSKIGDPVFCDKLKKFTDSSDETKTIIRNEAAEDAVDLIVAILRSELLSPPLNSDQIGKVYNAYVAWDSAVENVDEEMKQGAQLFSYMKQLLKLYTRQRDKSMMLRMIEEPVTLQLLRDLFTIFYEPLVRVYKSANVYGSVTDFAVFVDDMIQVIEKCREQDVSADPNQTVQAFIDLCQRHEHNFYKFVHEVHTHDNGLFTQLMGWIEGILEFLRQGPKAGKLDINALVSGAVSVNQLDKEKAVAEIDSLITWQEARKKWHQDKTRQKMAADGIGANVETVPGGISFKSEDFGLNQMDLQDMNYEEEEDSSDEDEEDDELDPIAAERKRRARKQDHLRRTAGEPIKPVVVEVERLRESFLSMLRMVLAE